MIVGARNVPQVPEAGPMSFIGAPPPPVVMGIVGVGWVHYLETVLRLLMTLVLSAPVRAPESRARVCLRR